jgi:hypothetical protein
MLRLKAKRRKPKRKIKAKIRGKKVVMKRKRPPSSK